jgi:hypothetical protein
MAQQLTTEILNAALENLTAKRHQIDEQIAQVRRLMGNHHNGRPAVSEAPARKHHISAAGRKAIAEAQRRRWAEQRGPAAAAPSKSRKPKRKLSPEGRAAIVAALNKRWAAKRAQGEPASKTTTKSARTKAA